MKKTSATKSSAAHHARLSRATLRNNRNVKPSNKSRPATSASSRHIHFRRWLALWISLYILIIIVSVFQQKGAAITIIKLTGVLLCSVYSIQVFPKDYLLQAAMVTTFVADCFLACDNISVIGVMVFFVAQIIHLYRLSDKISRPKAFLVALIGLLAMACVNLIPIIPPIYVAVAFYVLILITNLVTSWQWQKQAPENPYAKAALAGFVLFCCCDICTGISYMSFIEVFPAFLYVPANFFAWFFYYPSQILVSNSSKCATIGSKEGKC